MRLTQLERVSRFMRWFEKKGKKQPERREFHTFAWGKGIFIGILSIFIAFSWHFYLRAVQKIIEGFSVYF